MTTLVYMLNMYHQVQIHPYPKADMVSYKCIAPIQTSWV